MSERSVFWSASLLMLFMPLSIYDWSSGTPIVAEFASQWMTQSFVSPTLHLSDIGVVVLLIGGMGSLWFWRPFARHSRQVSWWGHWIITVPLLLLSGVALVTAPIALFPGFAFYTAVRWIAAVGVYLVLVRAPAPAPALVLVLVGGLSIHALVGLAQILHDGGNIGIPGAIVVRGYRRAFGLTMNPNILGGFLSVGIITGLPLVKRSGVRIIWWLLWMGLTLTFSRSAWLAMVCVFPIALGILAWRLPTMRRALILATVGAVIVIIASGIVERSQVQFRFIETLEHMASTPADLMKFRDDAAQDDGDDTHTRAFAGRMDLVRIAFLSIADYPLTGVGAGNALAIEHFPQANFYPDYIHNVPLLLMVEIGLLGGVAWIWICAGTTTLLLVWRTDLSVWTVIFLCAWLLIMIISVFDGYVWATESGRLLTVTILAFVQKSLVLAPDTPGAPIEVAR